MKKIIQQIILDYHKSDISSKNKRLTGIAAAASPLRKAHVLMGIRRAGKTYLLYQHMQQLLSAGCPKEKLLYVNFEDDRLINFHVGQFQNILDAYFDLYPQYAQDKQVVFYFDEIHLIDGWEKFIRRLLDQEVMQVFVTGSSAKLLSKEIATTLRGRAWTQEVFPFSFCEYLHTHDALLDEPLSSKQQSQRRYHANHYLLAGGFPESLSLTPQDNQLLLQSYMNTVIFRDVVDRHKIANSHVVKMLLFHCLQNPASRLSITKLYHDLKSQGHTLDKGSLYTYLQYFEEAYALFSIPIYDFSLKKRQVNPKKIYPIDTGLIAAYTIKPGYNKGATLETAVFLQLRRHYTDIFYYRTSSQKEVDFIILTEQGALQLYQVAVDINDADTRARECSALVEAATTLNLTKTYLITEDHFELIQEGGIEIQCLPFWQWATTSM